MYLMELDLKAGKTRRCRNFGCTYFTVISHIQGISWGAVRYMLGEIQYGGRVTDDYDKHLLITYAKVEFH